MKISRAKVLKMLKAGKAPPFIAQTLNCRPGTIHKIRKELVDDGHYVLEEDGDDEDVDAIDVEDDADVVDGADVFDLDEPGALAAAEARNRVRTMNSQIAEKKAELELKQVQRRHDEFDQTLMPSAIATPAGSADGPLVPLLLQQLQAANQQNQALMLRMVESSSTPPATTGTESLTGLAKLVPAMQSLFEFVDGMRSDAEPKSTTESLIAGALEAWKAKNAAETQPAPQAGTPTRAEQVPSLPPAPVPDARAEGRRRATVFVQAVQQEIALRTDPYHVADQLEPALGALPGDLREAILTQPLEPIQAKVKEYVDDQVAESFFATIAASEQNAQWLADFLLSMRDEEDLPMTPDEQLVGAPANGSTDGKSNHQ